MKVIISKIPSVRVIILWVLANRKRTKDEIIIIDRSIMLKLDSVMVPKMATGIPNTTQALKMLLPIMFPSRRSCSPFMDETMVVTNSGKDVPRAIIVRAITRSDTPRLVAMDLALSTTRLLP